MEKKKLAANDQIYWRIMLLKEIESRGLSTPALGFIHVYLTTLLTSPIEFSLYFQNYVRHLNQNFWKAGKMYEMGLRSQIMRVNLFYKVPYTFEHSNPYFQKSQKSLD